VVESNISLSKEMSEIPVSEDSDGVPIVVLSNFCKCEGEIIYFARSLDQDELKDGKVTIMVNEDVTRLLMLKSFDETSVSRLSKVGNYTRDSAKFSRIKLILQHDSGEVSAVTTFVPFRQLLSLVDRSVFNVMHRELNLSQSFMIQEHFSFDYRSGQVLALYTKAMNKSEGVETIDDARGLGNGIISSGITASANF
jgi:hypothetical protein